MVPQNAINSDNELFQQKIIQARRIQKLQQSSQCINENNGPQKIQIQKQSEQKQLYSQQIQAPVQRQQSQQRCIQRKERLVIDGKFILKSKISQGGFGKVYLAEDIFNKTQVVIKVNSEKEMNLNEFEIMKDLSDKNIKGFPKVFSQGVVNNQPFIVLEKLGLSIKDILKRNKRHFSIKCVISLSIQMLDIIQRFHDQGYIHCDLKPDNIMIGDYKKDLRQMNKLYLIDFGISQRYLDQDGNHIPFSKNVPFKGNVIFSSKNAFSQITLSRRDDIISFVYFMIFCIDSNMSWIDSSKPVADQFESIGRFKIQTPAENFCDSKTKFLSDILNYAYKLEFDERPDYARLRFMMQKIMLDKEYLPLQRFDWSMHQREPQRRQNPNSRHSSISSCNIKSDEVADLEITKMSLCKKNLSEFQKLYTFDTNIHTHKFINASNSLKGKGQQYFFPPDMKNQNVLYKNQIAAAAVPNLKSSFQQMFDNQLQNQIYYQNQISENQIQQQQNLLIQKGAAISLRQDKQEGIIQNQPQIDIRQVESPLNQQNNGQISYQNPQISKVQNVLDQINQELKNLEQIIKKKDSENQFDQDLDVQGQKIEQRFPVKLLSKSFQDQKIIKNSLTEKEHLQKGFLQSHEQDNICSQKRLSSDHNENQMIVQIANEINKVQVIQSSKKIQSQQSQYLYSGNSAPWKLSQSNHPNQEIGDMQDSIPQQNSQSDRSLSQNRGIVYEQRQKIRRQNNSGLGSLSVVSDMDNARIPQTSFIQASFFNGQLRGSNGVKSIIGSDYSISSNQSRCSQFSIFRGGIAGRSNSQLVNKFHRKSGSINISHHPNSNIIKVKKRSNSDISQQVKKQESGLSQSKSVKSIIKNNFQSNSNSKKEKSSEQSESNEASYEKEDIYYNSNVFNNNSYQQQIIQQLSYGSQNKDAIQGNSLYQHLGQIQQIDEMNQEFEESKGGYQLMSKNRLGQKASKIASGNSNSNSSNNNSSSNEEEQQHIQAVINSLSQSSYNIKNQKKRVVVGVGLSSANSQSILEDSEYNEYDIQLSAVRQINEDLQNDIIMERDENKYQDQDYQSGDQIEYNQQEQFQKVNKSNEEKIDNNQVIEQNSKKRLVVIKKQSKSQQLNFAQQFKKK